MNEISRSLIWCRHALLTSIAVIEMGSLLYGAPKCRWREIPDVYGNTSLYHAGVYDVDACKKACIEKINGCIAVESHSTPFCWYHTRGTVARGHISASGRGFVQYWLDCPSRMSAIKFAVEATPCHWEETRNVYSKGSKLYLKASGIEQCKTACSVAIESCVAIDNYSDAYCWYHTNRTLVTSRRTSVQPQKGYVQFLRVGDC